MSKHIIDLHGLNREQFRLYWKTRIASGMPLPSFVLLDCYDPSNITAYAACFTIGAAYRAMTYREMDTDGECYTIVLTWDPDKKRFIRE